MFSLPNWQQQARRLQFSSNHWKSTHYSTDSAASLKRKIHITAACIAWTFWDAHCYRGVLMSHALIIGRTFRFALFTFLSLFVLDGCCLGVGGSLSRWLGFLRTGMVSVCAARWNHVCMSLRWRWELQGAEIALMRVHRVTAACTSEVSLPYSF